jgi:hypothetical protein
MGTGTGDGEEVGDGDGVGVIGPRAARAREKAAKKRQRAVATTAGGLWQRRRAGCGDSGQEVTEAGPKRPVSVVRRAVVEPVAPSGGESASVRRMRARSDLAFASPLASLLASALASTLALAAVACGDNSGDVEIETPPQCNPLGGASCVTPWPSAIYEIDDPGTRTGRRLAIPADALPQNNGGVRISPDPLNALDGFSPAAPMLIAFSTGIDPSNLVHYSRYEASITPESPTVLVDMSTGELVHHFAELDAPAAARPDRQALFIRSAAMLKGGTRYAVAIKRTLKAQDGSDLPIPEGFRAIRDGGRTTHALLEQVRPRYAAIFDALEAHGIARKDLVTAWDFTTSSRESTRADVLAARDAALLAMGPSGANLTYTVTTDTAPSDTQIARRIDGQFDAPLFLTNSGGTEPGTKLVRGPDGKPVTGGMYRVPFTAIVPACALQSQTPVPLMIYGHGLLGDSTQVASSGTRHASAELCMVVVGTDMRGMATVDVPGVASALSDANNGSLIFDVLVQGMVNHVAMVQIARGPMAQALFRKQNGMPLVDPSKFYYYGISQGGIMGGTVCAIDPVIERCVLQVGAINYSILLERSRDWPTYHGILLAAYRDPLDVTLVVNLMQHQWDRTEPTAIADVLVGAGVPGAPQKQVFMQIAIADDEVSNVASEYQARTMGIPTVTPSPYVPFGLQGSAGPVRNGLVIYDFGLGATIPPTNEPPPDNNVHSNIRNKRATIEMMRRFYATGEIVQLCTAPTGCDCTAGGCGADL